MFGKQRIDRRNLLQDSRQKNNRRYFWLLLFGLIIALTLGAVSIANAAANTQAETGHLQLRNNKGQIVDALHLATDVSMSIQGMVATVTYRQSFRNESSAWLEALYFFPLPATAAVNAMEMKIGERLIKGEIKEKQQARDIYQQAKKSGRRASLVEQQRPNMFTQRVANIGPGETIEVSLSYVQRVDYQFGQFSLRLPLTITPRYIPGAPLVNNSEIPLGQSGWGWSQATEQVPDADFITPFMRQFLANGDNNSASIAITLNAGLPLATLESPLHDINISRNGAYHNVEFSQGRETMDRDFVLQWQPVASKAPTAAVFSERVDGDDYLLLMLVPPQQQLPSTLPRNVNFVIDTSGSMQGTSIVQAKASLQMALQTLLPKDKFNIIDFNSSYQSFASRPLNASADNIQRAQAYVGALEAGGGTEMYAPLQQSLTDNAKSAQLAQIIFITDGSVGNEEALFKLIKAELGSARLFTVAIGSAPNSYFMRKAAQFGRGSFTHIGNSSEVSVKMSRLFLQLQSPLLRDISVEWPQHSSVDMNPQRIGDLYRGQPLLLTAKLLSAKYPTAGNPSKIVFKGNTQNGPWRQTVTLTQPVSRTGVASLWARDKISTLLDNKTAGANESGIKQKILTVALAHQLISPYTSFVAVEQMPARGPNTEVKTKSMANQVALGQTLTAHNYPNTALGLYWQLLLGLGGLLLAGLIYRPMRRNGYVRA
tara:strand:- start:568 stop:2703 length:2136 start_codon:yes stop_codon:yes gene_type:complete